VYGITATTHKFQRQQQLPAIQFQMSLLLSQAHTRRSHTAYNEDKKTEEKGEVLMLKQLTNLFDRIVAGDGEEVIFYAIDKSNKELKDGSNNKSDSSYKKEL
jgi:hypothetical protein